jgi:amino acid efflux transporter
VINAYVVGASELVGRARVNEARRPQVSLTLAILSAGALLIVPLAIGWVSIADALRLPTALYVTVYLGCTASAARLFRGTLRILAVAACVAITAILLLLTWATVLSGVVLAAAVVPSSRKRCTSRHSSKGFTKP